METTLVQMPWQENGYEEPRKESHRRRKSRPLTGSKDFSIFDMTGTCGCQC